MNPVVQILLSSIIPALLALAGILYVQHSTAKSSQTDSEREQFRWTRENRKECYLALIAECQWLSRWMGMYSNVGWAGKDGEYGEPGLDWMKDAFAHLTKVEMFASEEAGTAAKTLVATVEPLRGGTPGSGMRFEDALEAFRSAAQEDLGLTGTTLGKRKWDPSLN